ncbi:hypothetical protein D3C76_1579820 [compost metagenome]
MSGWFREGSPNILTIAVKIIHIRVPRPLQSQVTDVLDSGKLSVHLLVRRRNRYDGLNVETLQVAQRLVRTEPASRILRHGYRLAAPGMSD